MQKLIQALIDKITLLDSVESFEKSKIELIQGLKKLAIESDIYDFKISKALKDKNILNSLLTKTSEDLEIALNQLKNQADELNILINTIPAMVYFKDSKLRYRLANKAFLDFSGLTKEELIGKSLHSIFKDYIPFGDYEKKEQKVIEQGKLYFHVEEQLQKNNKTIWVHTNIAPVRNQKGKIIGLIGVSWDITDQKNYEQTLTKAKELAEEGERIKDQFLTNMSHEIRTPLNGIIGMAEVLENTELKENQKEYLYILKNSGEHLINLINDVFEYSAIEKGEIKPNYEIFNLKDLLKQIIDLFKPQIEKKGITFNSEINSPDYIKSDKKLIEKIIRNLMSNAIKFTDKGNISLNVKKTSQKEDKITLLFSLKDTGIGVQPQHLSRLFGSFTQVDNSSTKKYQGTGLGLAISKKLVEMLKGKIGVESKWKQGSEFWFEIPAIAIKKENSYNNEKILLKEILNGFRVLLVEDNLINQKITKMTLEKEGCIVDVAGNGKECLEKYHNKYYDLILMDIQMPVMDGLEATRRIRKYEKTHNDRRSFIVALTANALKEDKERALKAGVDGFIAKPFKPDELFQILYRFIIRK